MKVVFRVDASQHIGSGHVMRCLVLAEALRLEGHKVLFATRSQVSDLNTFIKSKGFELIPLKQPSSWLIPKHTGDYTAWLQVRVEQDCEDFLSKVNSANLVIVDHYGITANWHEKVKRRLGCVLMVIDDLVREHYADIVLDQTLNRYSLEYTQIKPCLALTGTDYALLKPDFSVVRSRMQSLSPQNHRLLISMGGIDKPNTSLRALNALASQSKKINTTVLLSQRSPHFEEVKAFALAHAEWVEHVEFVDDMPNFMNNYTVMVGAPGSTSWERACLGIPSVIVPIADNQLTIAQQLEKAKAVKVIELDNIEDEIIPAINEIISQWASYRANNLLLCDGLGCMRVVTQLKRLIKSC